MARAEIADRKRAAAAALFEGQSLPQGASWAQSAREESQAHAMLMGLPEKRDEYWKFAGPTPFTQADLPRSSDLAQQDTSLFAQTDSLRLVFVDGVFDAAASDDLAGQGITIETLSDVTAKAGHWAMEIFGQFEGAGQKPVPRPLAAVNTALATEGVVIHAFGVVTRPVQILYRQSRPDADVMLHHLLRVDPDARLTVIETGTAGARVNSVIEVDVAPSGAFHHLRIQGRDHDRTGLHHLFARLGEESLFKSFTLSANGAVTRNETVLTLTGDRGIAHVAGACLGAGADFIHDDTVFITHDAENCESRQVFKKVLRNGATGVFQGKILVQPGAQKTDGYQISQSLLLDEDAQFLAKPELEIYADDVACSHGSTSGAIDERGLFYLRARGIPKADAMDLMTIAFLAEALDEIEAEDLSAVILDALPEWLLGHRV